jgi:hypothetical protein
MPPLNGAVDFVLFAFYRDFAPDGACVYKPTLSLKRRRRDIFVVRKPQKNFQAPLGAT